MADAQMDTGGTTLAELTTVWDERGIVISDLALAQDGTIVDPRGPNRFPMPAGDTAPLPLADGAALRVGATIGSGGMGLVRSAVQVPLDREVAVKSLRPDVQRTLGAAELVREARVTGRLEHPNIVPIHALAADEDHQPLLVMKRIDGVPWTDYLASKPLDFHLDVLLDVCNALSFAHSRGVIHRDLKPENVMNGAFGEVYLLDWGLAVSTDPELADRMQLARDITRLAGTPQYMAPEMAAANASQIGEQTDVYLLGSVLHECVTGTYRHDGNDLRATLLQSWMSEPKTYDETVPRELGGICNRATARDPGDRYASVEAFREAIVAFRMHRGSEELVGVANKPAEQLLDPEADSGFQADIRAAFAEARFGYRQALREWPANAEASRRLERTLGRMAELEVGWEQPEAAAALLDEMTDPPSLLRDQVVVLRDRRAALEAMERAHNMATGTRTRSFATMIISVIFTAISFGLGSKVRAGEVEYGYGVFFAVALTFALVNGALFLWARDTLTRTVINRRISKSLIVMSLGMLLLPLGVMPLGVDPAGAVSLTCLLIAVVLAVMSGTIDGRLAISSAIYVGAWLAGAYYPTFALEAIGTAVALSGCLVAWMWAPEDWFRRTWDEVP